MSQSFFSTISGLMPIVPPIVLTRSTNILCLAPGGASERSRLMRASLSITQPPSPKCFAQDPLDLIRAELIDQAVALRRGPQLVNRALQILVPIVYQQDLG